MLGSKRREARETCPGGCIKSKSRKPPPTVPEPRVLTALAPMQSLRGLSETLYGERAGGSWGQNPLLRGIARRGERGGAGGGVGPAARGTGVQERS